MERGQMRALFVYSGSFFIDKEGSICNKIMNYDMFSRYKTIFNTITVAGRYKVEPKIKTSKKDLVEGPGISFVGLVEKKNKFSVNLNKKRIIRKFKQAIEANDVLIARVPSQIAYWAIAIAKKKSKPLIVEVVGCPFDSLFNHGSILGKVYAPFAKAKLRRIMKTIDYAIYVTEKFLQRRYPCRGKSIACSNVEIKNYKNENFEKRINKINGKSEDEPFIIGLMGCLDVNYKGHRVALKAVKELKKRGLKVVLKFAGGGDITRWYKLARKLNVRDNMQYSGFLSKEEVEKWLQEIDIYIQPSKQEGLPRAVVEAMSFACPVVGSNIAGIPELIEEDYLIEPGDFQNLADKIYMLATNKERAFQQAKRNFEKAEDYTFDKLNTRREKLFKNLISSVL